LKKTKLLYLLPLLPFLLNADFKFKLSNKITKQEVEEIKYKEPIKQNPKTNILKVMDKQILKAEIKDTDFRIIDMVKYKKTIGLKYNKVKIGVEVSGSDKVSYVEYRLETNKWYIIRKNENILKFIEYKSLSKKDFNKYDAYFKISKNKIKILTKTKSKFIPITVNVEKSIILSEINPDDFTTTKYKIYKLKGEK